MKFLFLSLWAIRATTHPKTQESTSTKKDSTKGMSSVKIVPSSVNGVCINHIIKAGIITISSYKSPIA